MPEERLRKLQVSHREEMWARKKATESSGKMDGTNGALNADNNCSLRVCLVYE